MAHSKPFQPEPLQRWLPLHGRNEWIVTPGAFDPIIDPTTFAEAQRTLEGRTTKKSDEEILNSLKGLLAREGRLSLDLVQNAADVPSPSTYIHRFGSLRKAYELIGYGSPSQFGFVDQRRRTQALREELVARIAALLPNDVQIVWRSGRWRSRLRLRN